MLLPFQGATAPTRDTQGVASLALGYVLHWAFSPPLLKTCVSHNPKDNTKKINEKINGIRMDINRFINLFLFQISLSLLISEHVQP